MKVLRSLFPFIKKYNVFLLFGFLFIIIQNYGMVKVPATIKSILDEIVKKNRKEEIVNGIFKVLFFTIIIAISLFLMRKIIIGVSRKIEYDIRKKLFKKLISIDYYFFLQNKSGDLSSRLTNDLNEVRVLLGPGMMYIPNSISRIFFFIPVLIGLSGMLMAITGVMMIGLIILILYLMPKIRPYFLKIQQKTGSINNRVWQILTGISTIKQNTMEEGETKRFLDLGKSYFKDQMSLVVLRGFFRPLFIFIFSLIELTILYIGGAMVIDGKMSIGELLQFNIMVSALIFPVLSFGWVMSMVQQGISAMGRINYILDREIPDNKNKVVVKDENLFFHVKNLNFKYPGDISNTLKNVSFFVKPGEIIGITGLIGSGKTTLLDILTGILKPEPGMVYVNNIDITRINIESYYNKISVVSQNPFLFSKTISENISLGLKKTDINQVKKIAKSAALDKEIEGFKNGYDQVIGERGILLSGGQKQRTAIARALIKPAQVLFLDDPLSSVDSKTEEIILNNLNQLTKKNLFKTVFIVSHRISALKNADTILVFKNGEILEYGDHKKLLNIKGLYYKLSEMQKMEGR